MDDEALVVVLDDLVRRLGNAGITWSLGGSASRRVRGAARAPRDVDVLVDADAGHALADALGDLQPPDHPAPPEWHSAWLLVWQHPSGVDVEFIGGGAVVVDDVLVELPARPSVEISWRGRFVPVSSPDTWDVLGDVLADRRGDSVAGTPPPGSVGGAT